MSRRYRRDMKQKKREIKEKDVSPPQYRSHTRKLTFVTTADQKGYPSRSYQNLMDGNASYIFFFMPEFTFTLQRDFIQSSRAKAISACGRVTSMLLVCRPHVWKSTSYWRLTKHQNHPCAMACFMKTLPTSVPLFLSKWRDTVEKQTKRNPH